MVEPNEPKNLGRRAFVFGTLAIGALYGIPAIATRNPFWPIELASYIVSKSDSYNNELKRQIDTYGETGDRIAYGVNHLAELRGERAVPADTVGQVAEFWKGLDADTKNFVDGKITPPTAAILADYVLSTDARDLTTKFPRLTTVHAHTNAPFALSPMSNITENDGRLVAIANARYTQGKIQPDLSYGNVREHGVNISKPDFVRSGFRYWAENFGSKLNSIDSETLAATVNQTMAGDVIDQLGTIQYNKGGTKDLLWFESYNQVEFPMIYAYSTEDKSYNAVNTNGFGLKTMNTLSMKLPDNLKYNWQNGSRTFKFATFYRDPPGLTTKIDEWLLANYGKNEVLSGSPEEAQSFYKKLFASQGLPAYTFEVLTRDFQLSNQTYPLSSYFTVGGEGGNGVSTLDSLIFSPKSAYLIDLEQSIANLKQYGWAGTVDYLRVYTPHRWHTGNLFNLLWKRS